MCACRCPDKTPRTVTPRTQLVSSENKHNDALSGHPHMNIMVLVSAARVIVPWWLPPRGLLSGGRGLLSEGLVCDSSLCDDRCDR